MDNETIAEELDRLYQYEMDKYLNECNFFKKAGYKIYRNPEGKHKVVKPVKKEDYKTAFSNAFGDIFGEIFGGGR